MQQAASLSEYILLAVFGVSRGNQRVSRETVAPPPPFPLCCNALQGRARSIVSIAESPEAPSSQRLEGWLAPFLTLDSRCVNTYLPLRKMRWCTVTSSWRI